MSRERLLCSWAPCGVAPCSLQVFDPTLIPRDDLVASGNVTIDFAFPFTATAGFCGALCNSEYAIYLVAQDKQVTAVTDAASASPSP